MFAFHVPSNAPTQMSGKQTQISGKQKQISGKQTQISGKQAQISGKQTQISGKQTQISGKLPCFWVMAQKSKSHTFILARCRALRKCGFSVRSLSHSCYHVLLSFGFFAPSILLG